MEFGAEGKPSAETLDENEKNEALADPKVKPVEKYYWPEDWNM